MKNQSKSFKFGPNAKKPRLSREQISDTRFFVFLYFFLCLGPKKNKQTSLLSIQKLSIVMTKEYNLLHLVNERATPVEREENPSVARDLILQKPEKAPLPGWPLAMVKLQFDISQ